MGENFGIEVDGGLAWTVVGIFEGGAPFGEASTKIIILGKALWQAFEAFGVFFVAIFHIFEALVDLDAGHNATVVQKFDESLAVVGFLASSFIKENDAVDIIFEIWRSEENIAIIATVVFVVWNIHGFKFLVDRAARFVGGKNALAESHEAPCVFFDFRSIAPFWVCSFDTIVIVANHTFECAKIAAAQTNDLAL